METCGMGFVKYLLFIFNLVFAISGVGIIVAGALVLADVGEFSHFLEGRILAPPVVLIVAGAIVFLVAFLGCFGAIRESHSLLIAFAISLLIIFVIELAVGIAAAVFKSDFQMALKDQFRTSMSNYDKTTEDKDAWNDLQKTLECCGVDGPSDWHGPDSASKVFPPSCCHATREGTTPPTEAQCRIAKPADTFVYQEGCYPKLQEKIEQGAKVLIGVGIGIAFVEVIGIILACWLASSVKKEDGDQSTTTKSKLSAPILCLTCLNYNCL